MSACWDSPADAGCQCSVSAHEAATTGAGMKKEHVSENSIMIYDDVMYPDNVTYEHIGEISIS
jgi:hypothetical protein